MAPVKGKQGTKGMKQIFDENKDTLAFYRNVVFGVNGIFFGTTYLLSFETTWTQISLFVFSTIIYFASYQFMSKASKPVYSETGGMIDCGVDLNMPDGIIEHVKDILILTMLCQILSLASNWFWLLWLAVPTRAGWMLWVNVISPWVFQPTPEIDDKKQKKMERRMKRNQNAAGSR